MSNFISFRSDLIQVTTDLVYSTQTYNIVYDANIATVSQSYKLVYKTTSTSLFSVNYILSYISSTAPISQNYIVNYTAGVVLSSNVQTYSLKWSSPTSTVTTLIYSLPFTTTGILTLNQRTIYRITYETSPINIVTTAYKFKFLSDTTDINTQDYTINFNTDGTALVKVLPTIVRGVDSEVDTVFAIYSTIALDMSDTLFVMANLPKYQLVEYTTTETTVPYVTFHSTADLYSLDLEIDNRTPLEPAYQCRGYIVLKDVEELNPISMDVYSISQGYKQLNDSRSYFFDLSTPAFVSITATIDGKNYTVKNSSIDYFNSNYLNFAKTEITPLFKLTDDCCFSQKIEQTIIGGTPCSPF
jgi:hypothetical protein